MSPGRGDFPVGQLDAQNLLPKGKGTPSFASSATSYEKVDGGFESRSPWLIRAAANV